MFIGRARLQQLTWFPTLRQTFSSWEQVLLLALEQGIDADEHYDEHGLISCYDASHGGIVASDTLEGSTDSPDEVERKLQQLTGFRMNDRMISDETSERQQTFWCSYAALFKTTYIAGDGPDTQL